jgi:hypothetical protein
MSSIGLNMDPLLYGAAIALAAVLLGTPLLWRLLRGVPHAARALATNLACIGLAGLCALPFAFASSRLAETVIFAVVISAALQGVALLAFLLFSPKRP